MSEYEYHRCVNPHCNHVQSVKFIPATRIDPSYPDIDYCSVCGDDLNWEQEAYEEPEPDYEAIEEQRLMQNEPEGDVW